MGLKYRLNVLKTVSEETEIPVYFRERLRTEYLTLYKRAERILFFFSENLCKATSDFRIKQTQQSTSPTRDTIQASTN